MKQDINKIRPEKTVNRKFNATDVKNIIRELLVSEVDPKNILRDFHELSISATAHDPKTSQEARDKINKLSANTINVVGLDTHYPIAETVTNNRTLIIEFANQLVSEYGCTTASEKSLVHVVAGAYGRVLEYSKLFNNCQRVDYLSHVKNEYYSMLSKELDRAERHYLAAMNTLIQMKKPVMNVKINANTAFVGQNQQFNSPHSHEIDKL